MSTVNSLYNVYIVNSFQYMFCTQFLNLVNSFQLALTKLSPKFRNLDLQLYLLKYQMHQFILDTINFTIHMFIMLLILFKLFLHLKFHQLDNEPPDVSKFMVDIPSFLTFEMASQRNLFLPSYQQGIQNQLLYKDCASNVRIHERR